MDLAICIFCGSEKEKPLHKCNGCSVGPTSPDEQLASVALSTLVIPRAQLLRYQQDQLSGLELNLPDEAFEEAARILKSIEDAEVASNIPSREGGEESPGAADARTRGSPFASRSQSEPVPKTLLHKSPFYILGASVHDDSRAITELAEAWSLEIDPDACQKARSILTNPRTRIQAEVSWLPGVPPHVAKQVLSRIAANSQSLRDEIGLPTLALVNAWLAAFETSAPDLDTQGLVKFVYEIADLSESISLSDVQNEINEDRRLSRFPELRSIDQLEVALNEHRRQVRASLRTAIEALASGEIISVMTELAELATAEEGESPNRLVEELVGAYELECQEFLTKEGENVRKLVSSIEKGVPRGDAIVGPLIDKLEEVIRNWDKVAQPIQLIAKAKGIDHDLSRELSFLIRNMAIDLFNQHDLLQHAQRITLVLTELFAELPIVSERLEMDAGDLNEVAERRKGAKWVTPIKEAVQASLKEIEIRPKDAASEARKIIAKGEEILASPQIPKGSPTIDDIKNFIALGVMACAVTYGNATSDWKVSESLLSKALDYVNEAELREKIQANLATTRSNLSSLGDLKPISSAPSLSTINGIGFALYGATDRSPRDGSYLATYYFTFLFFPIFPITRYRVLPTEGGYRFLGEASLRPFDKFHIAFSLIAIVIVYMAMSK